MSVHNITTVFVILYSHVLNFMHSSLSSLLKSLMLCCLHHILQMFIPFSNICTVHHLSGIHYHLSSVLIFVHCVAVSYVPPPPSPLFPYLFPPPISIILSLSPSCFLSRRFLTPLNLQKESPSSYCSIRHLPVCNVCICTSKVCVVCVNLNKVIA